MVSDSLSHRGAEMNSSITYASNGLESWRPGATVGFCSTKQALNRVVAPPSHENDATSLAGPMQACAAPHSEQIN